jgi:hypothetical protein
MNLDENLVKLVTQKPGPRTPAARLAKTMGLQYMGFGRYADKTGKIKYTVDKQGNLIPFKNAGEIDSMYREYASSKWNDLETFDPDKSVPDKKKREKVAEKLGQLKGEIDRAQKDYSKRRREDRKVMFFKNKEEKQLDKSLRDFYKKELFSNDEISALHDYVGWTYDQINSYLYKGFDPQDHNVPRNKEVMSHLHKSMVDLDNAFEGVEAPFDFPTYAGLGPSVPIKNLRAGSKYLFRGYFSTSIAHEVPIDSFAYEHGDTKGKKEPYKVLLQIDIKKGDPGIYVGDIVHTRREKEFLLPRGTMIEILSGPHPFTEDAVTNLSYFTGEETRIMLFHCRIVREKEDK